MSEKDLEQLPGDAMSLVSKLAAQIRDVTESIDGAEKLIKELKAQLMRLETERLPEAMSNLGLTLFRLQDGSEISVAPEYHCSITASRKEAAHQCLMDLGLGDIIRSSVWAEFDRGEHELATEALEKLREQFPATPNGIESKVHPATLKATVKEMHESGNPLPEDLFGVFIINRATIKSPKLKTKSRK
jgi:hypothetical protein